MGAGMPMMHMGAVPLDQNDGSISQNLYNGRGNYRLSTILISSSILSCKDTQSPLVATPGSH